MKKFLSFLVIVGSISTMSAQETNEEQVVKEAIVVFFDGFHARDSTIMKSVVNDAVIMQSIGKDGSGEIALHQGDFGAFLKSITAIPEGTSFQEKLHSYKIRVDGNMANVWTPYSLFVNDQFSHCGVNNFQLFKKDGVWKIIYLIDTRRTEGCELAFPKK